MIVPTVERGLCEVAFCSMLIAGRQALDDIDVGLVHQLQELPRVGRQALDIAPLAFGIQGVEGQARLARARQPGDHHQRIARDVEVDVLQVVRARAADAELGAVGRHVGPAVESSIIDRARDADRKPRLTNAAAASCQPRSASAAIGARQAVPSASRQTTACGSKLMLAPRRAVDQQRQRRRLGTRGRSRRGRLPALLGRAHQGRPPIALRGVVRDEHAARQRASARVRARWSRRRRSRR